MATVVDICNTALNYLGEAGNLITVDPTESTYESELCKRFYPICRDSLLEEHPWTFSTRRAYLALKGEDAFGWKCKYVVPSDSMKVLSVIEESDRYFQNPHDFMIESDSDGDFVIYTDLDNAVCRYTFCNENTATYPEYFCDALSLLLAIKLAGAIVKGITSAGVEQKLMQYYRVALSNAKTIDAQQNKIPNKILASFYEEGVYRG